MVRKLATRWHIAGAAIALLVAATLLAGFAQAARAQAAHTVELTIVAGKTAGGGSLDFNNYQRGAMTVTVPVGWHVVVHFSNAGAMPHSVGVLPTGAHQQAMLSAAPVFQGAATGNFSAGLPKGAEQTFTFEASKAGTFELICGCPGHGIGGMWDTLVVSSTAEAPSVTPAGAATIVSK
jgi:sulfocyanin